VPTEESHVRYHNLRPYAEKVYLHSQESCTCAGAWAQAVAKVGDRRLRGSHTSGAIVPVVQRLLLFQGMTTSGVEQSFGSLTQVLGRGQRDNMKADRDLDELKIKVDGRDAEMGKVIGRAQKIWDELFGRARTHAGPKQKPPRFVAGSKRTRAGMETTEKNWIFLRRKRVAVLAARAGKRPFSAVTEDSARQASWSETLENEAAHLVTKRRKTRISAFEAGLLLPPEIDQSLAEEADAEKATREENDRKHDRDFLRRASLSAPTAPGSSSHKRAHLDAKLPADVAARVRRAAAEQKLEVVGDDKRLDADLYVVADLAAPGQRTLWAARLTGGRLASADWVLRRGKSAASLVYRPAIRTRRTIWVSQKSGMLTPSWQRCCSTLLLGPCVPPGSPRATWAHARVAGGAVR
jgi:hypothetical protein